MHMSVDEPRQQQPTFQINHFHIRPPELVPDIADAGGVPPGPGGWGWAGGEDSAGADGYRPAGVVGVAVEEGSVGEEGVHWSILS
jgi:hypothetical protein